MHLFLRALCGLAGLLLLSGGGSAQTNTNATGKRISYGPESTTPGLQSAYQSFVIPADQQQGIPLAPIGVNADLFGGARPWFMRTFRYGFYTPKIADPLTYEAIQNPLAAYGESGGGTPLYTDREYRFGVHGGYRDASRLCVFRIRAFQKSQFTGSAVDVLPVAEKQIIMPWEGTAEWEAFLAAGAKHVEDFRGLHMTIEVVQGATGQSRWHTALPYLLTMRCADPEALFAIDFVGWATPTQPMASVALPPAANNAAFRPLFTVDFTARPPWRSTFLDAPHFTGAPAPSEYLSMSQEELSGLGGFSPPTPAAAYQNATTIDDSPELRQHPKLDKLVADLGNDPVAIANYVFNEIELRDALADPEDETVDPKGIWPGGMSRSAFGTYLEGAGNPWEQCALLVYMMRKAGYPAVYVEPYKDNLLMLDTQLEKVLRMRIKGAVDPQGKTAMPTEVPVHYPWVAVRVPDDAAPGQYKWVHLFPWIKDSSVIEGANLYEKFPDDCKNAAEWVAKYIKGDPQVLSNQVPAYLPDSAGNFVMEAEGYTDNFPSRDTRRDLLGVTTMDQWLLRDAEPMKYGLGSYGGPSGFSGDGWLFGTTIRGYYVNGSAAPDFSDPALAPIAEYAIDVPAAGDYHIWLRAAAGGSNNDCFVSLNGSLLGTAKLPGSNNQWNWTNKYATGAVMKFTATQAGRNVIQLAVGRLGFSLDKIVVSPSASYTPSGDGGTVSKQVTIEQNVPSKQFVRFAREKLAEKGVNFDDVGMKYLDRRRNRNALDEFPRPYKLNAAAHPVYRRLLERERTFDKVRITIKKNDLSGTEYYDPNVKLDTGDLYAMDLHDRPFYVATRRVGNALFRLRFVLGALRDSATGTGNFSGANMADQQVMDVGFDYHPNGDDYSTIYNIPELAMEVTHLRQRHLVKTSLANLTVTDQGNNYTSTPVVTVAPPPGLADNAGYRAPVVQAVVTARKITGFVIIDPGYGYDATSAPPAVTITGGGGSQAKATCTLVPQAPYEYLNADGGWKHGLGVNTANKLVNKPSISEGDMAALCLRFGTVSKRMVDHFAENYWKLERQMKANGGNTSNIDFREKAQAFSIYLMGMEYYRRLSDFDALNDRLHKATSISAYSSGLSRLQAFRTNYNYGSDGVVNGLPRDQDPSYLNAGVDMFSFITASTGAAGVHNDNGMPDGFNERQLRQLSNTEYSAQEHQIINDYYGEKSAVSTIRLLQRAHANQGRVTPAQGIVRLTKGNYLTAEGGGRSIKCGTVTKSLRDWGPQAWPLIDSIFAGPDGAFVEVFITPGNVANSSGSYNGSGALFASNSMWGAIISTTQGYYNGGYGSPFTVPRYEPAFIANNSLTFGPSGYTLAYSPPGPSATFAPPSIPTWQLSQTHADILAGQMALSPYQASAWGQQAGYYGLSSGTNAANYMLSESRGTLGGTSFFGAIGNLISGWVADPVDVVTGDFYIDAVDLTLPGPMPLSLRRNYSSLSVSDGEFGHGWKSSIVGYIGVSDTGLLYAAEADGSVIAYKRDAVNTNLYLPTVADNPALKNAAEKGTGSSSNPMNNRIVKSLEGTAEIYTLSGPDGNERRFRKRSFPIGTGADLISRERPYLESWKDAHGNQLSFTYAEVSTEPDYGQLTRISASNGNSLGFTYDTSGHITEAWTQDGRRVAYEYDMQGDLVKVTLPDGAEHRYTYEYENTTTSGAVVSTSRHLLIRESRPEGRIIENDYDSQRRVVRQRAVVGPSAQPVQNAEFIYASTQNTTTKTWTGTTTVKDAYGRPTVYTYADGLITSEDDPETPAETRVWYGATETGGGAYPRSIRQITDRRGVVKFFQYDARGNLILKSLGTDASPADIDGDGVSSPGEKSVTTWTYTDKNLPETQTEPSGIVTKWFYTDARFPYLATATERWSGATLITRTTREFCIRSASGSSARGMVEREKEAEGTADEAVVTWDYDAHGFPTSKTSATGTADPDITVFLKHNLRGEMIEERQPASGALPEQKWSYEYDAMGRKVISRRTAGGLKSAEQIHYTLNGEVEWTDGNRTGVNDRVLNRYDKNGRQIEKLQWLSGWKSDGSGVTDLAGDEAVATTFCSYDLFNNLTNIRTPRGHSIAMDYDGIGRMKRIDYYSGYKGLGGVIAGTRQFLYEDGGEVSQETDALGGVTKSFYNGRGQLRRRENADGSVEQWRFYPDGRPFQEILRNGTRKELIYQDADRRVIEVLRDSGGNILKAAVSLYDRRGNLISETKAASVTLGATPQIIGPSFTTTTTYDDLNRVKTVTGPPATDFTARRVDTHSYPDPLGNRTIVTNALGESTITSRDALGRITSVEVRDAADALVRITTHSFSADNNKVTTTEGTGPDAIVTERWTDTVGNNVIDRRANGATVYTKYLAGEVAVYQYDPLGRRTDKAYDWQGNVTGEITYSPTGVPGTLVTYVYDAAGNLLERRMPGGLTSKSEYDSAGRPHLTKLVQGGSTSRLVNYDYYPTGHLWAGMRKSVTDARNIATTYTYDSSLRVAAATSTGPDPEDAVERVHTYDILDNPATVTRTGVNGSVQVERTTDDRGAIITDAVGVDGAPYTRVIQRYDGAGRRFSLGTSGEWTRDFTHRADGLPSGGGADGRTYQYGYTTAGLLSSRSGPFQSTTIGRDNVGRITSRTLTVGGAQVLQESVPAGGWTAIDKLAKLQTVRAGAPNETREFGYDWSYRLANETYPAAAAVNDSIAFFYDSYSQYSTGQIGALVGRYRSNAGSTFLYRQATLPVPGDFARIKSSSHADLPRDIPLAGIAAGASQVDLSMDGAPAFRALFPGAESSSLLLPGADGTPGAWSAVSRLRSGSHTLTATAIHPSDWKAPAATSTFTVAPRAEALAVTYDEMGNVATRTWAGGTSQVFSWDADNHLVKVVQTGSGPSVWTALYDGLGRRVRTNWTPQGGASVTTRSLHDPDVEFLSIGEGVSIGSGGVSWSWKTYGPDISGTDGGLQGMGGLEAVTDETGYHTRGIVSDWWGNTAGWINQDGGAVTWNMLRFGAWGNAIGIEPPVQDGRRPLHELLGYRGLTTDPPGYIQMGLRSYDPLEGTWLSTDPMGHAGSLSLYSYCDNDPVNVADPDGRFGKAVTVYLTGYAGDTAGKTSGQIWDTYNATVGVQHNRELDAMLEWVPGVNAVKWGLQGISGRNWITGADLTVEEQIGSTFQFGVSVLSVKPGSWISPGGGTGNGIGSGIGSGIGTGTSFSNLSAPARGLRNTAVTIESNVGREAARTAGLSEQPRNALGQFMSRTPGQSAPGFNAVDDFVAHSQANGMEILGREVSFSTPFGTRRYDVVLRNPATKATSGIEIKSSAGAMGRWDAAARQQFAADRWINMNGGATSIGGKGGITIESTYKLQW